MISKNEIIRLMWNGQAATAKKKIEDAIAEHRAEISALEAMLPPDDIIPKNKNPRQIMNNQRTIILEKAEKHAGDQNGIIDIVQIKDELEQEGVEINGKQSPLRSISNILTRSGYASVGDGKYIRSSQ